MCVCVYSGLIMQRWGKAELRHESRRRATLDTSPNDAPPAGSGERRRRAELICSRLCGAPVCSKIARRESSDQECIGMQFDAKGEAGEW